MNVATEIVKQVASREQFHVNAKKRMLISASRNPPVSLLLISIDNFREVGGTANSICMRSVTDVIYSNISPKTDLLGLVRDHQFALMPANCDAKSLTELAERIRLQVESLQIKPTVQGGPLTVSISMAVKAPEMKPSIEALLIVADRSLRESVRFGGNCVNRGNVSP